MSSIVWVPGQTWDIGLGTGSKLPQCNTSCCLVITEGSTDNDSGSLGIKINLQVNPQISVLKNKPCILILW